MKDDTKELVALSQAGDMEAFERLIQRYQTKIYNIAYRLSGNPHDASDLSLIHIYYLYQNVSRLRSWRQCDRHGHG